MTAAVRPRRDPGRPRVARGRVEEGPLRRERGDVYAAAVRVAETTGGGDVGFRRPLRLGEVTLLRADGRRPTSSRASRTTWRSGSRT